MDAKLTKWILPVLLLIIATDIWAQGPTGTDVSVESSVSITDTLPQKKSFFKNSWTILMMPTKRKNKKFDFSVIGGPHYSSDTKFGIGLVAAGLYRTDLNDTILPPSNVSLYGDVSTVGFYLLGVRGNHLFPQDKYRLNYNLYFYSFPSLYWGKDMKTVLMTIMKVIMTASRHK